MIIERKARHAVTEHGPVLKSTSRETLSTPPKSMPGPYLNKASKIKDVAMAIALSLLLIIVIQQIGSVTISSVVIGPASPKTTDILNCSFTVSGSAGESVNVSWYNNSVLYNTSNDVTSPVYLDSSLTKKNQVWNCTVVVGNSTTVSRDSAAVTIQNSPPETPFIQYLGTDIGDSYTLVENQTYLFYLNTTDPDNDALIYYYVKTVGNDYCSINSTGWITCFPTSEPNLTINDEYIFHATDGTYGGAVGSPISFNVTPANDHPNMTYVSRKIITEGTLLSAIVSMGDEEDPNGPFTFNISSDYGDNRLENITTNNKSWTIRFLNNRTANFGDRGNHTVYMTACDPDASCISESFILEVIPVNNPPNITNISYTQKQQGENFTLYVNASDVDSTDTIGFRVSSSCSIANPWSISLLVPGSNATGMINLTLTNNHIICRNITITVNDTVGQTDSESLTLNILNVNDDPTINEVSNYEYNSYPLMNYNLTNLTAYTDIRFIYKINVTDPDTLTYMGEILNYTDNSSTCVDCPQLNMSSLEGIINFTPSSAHVGNFTYLITVRDDDNISDTALLVLRVLNNTPPLLTGQENFIANESILFNQQIGALDNQGDPINFSGISDITYFNINSTGYVSFMPICEDIGNHSVNLTIIDDKGAYTEDTVSIYVNNTPDTPYFNLVNITLLEEMPFYINLSNNVTDLDVNCSKVNDSISFRYNFVSPVNSTLLTVSSQGIINFTPNSTSQGSYLLNLTVNDTFGRTSFLFWNITIVNRTNPPIIHNITPYGFPYNSGWIPTPAANLTTINISENTSIIYSHNSTDPDGDPLIFSWVVDGVAAGSSSSLNKSWDFSSSGIHNVTLTVSDLVNGMPSHWVSFTWNTSIYNLNRAPELDNLFPNVTINRTREFTNWMIQGDNMTLRFYDPDGDALTYNYTSTSKVTISIQSNTITFVPVAVGLDSVIFTASDGYLSTTSNNISINVTNVPETSGEEGTSSSTETSTSSGSRTTYVPYSVISEIEKEKELYLDILVPEAIVIYKNNTVRQTISIVNTGNATLRGIMLSAQLNYSDAEINFSNEYIPELLPGEEEKTDMIITAYKTLNHYEVILWANVSDPAYKDKAIIYINAIEKSRGDQSVTATKITFAQDLLASNPECIELNEFLKRARMYIDQEDYQSASEILDSVIQGCKYLVSQSKLRDESPSNIMVNLGFMKNTTVQIAFGIFLVAVLAATFMILKTKKLNVEED